MSRILTSKSDTQYTKVAHHSRRRKPREVMFFCEVCQSLKTELRLPGATPKYCRACAPEVKRKQATERQQRHRQAVKDGTAVKTLSAADRKRFAAQMKQILGDSAKSEIKRTMEVIEFIDWLKEHGRVDQANELSKITNENVKQGYDLMINWIWDDVMRRGAE